MICRFALLAASAVASLASAQDASQRIDASYPAMPLSRLLPELGKQSHQTLRVTPALANDILVVRTKDVPRQELLDRIASVTAGEWRQEKGELVLAPSNSLERRRQSAWLADRTAVVRRAIAKLVESPEYRSSWSAEQARELAKETETVMQPASGRFDTNDKRVQALLTRSPGSRAIVALLNLIGPEALAAATVGGRTVFATSPTKMQSAPPSGAPAALNRLLQEHSMFVDATKEFLASRPPSQSMFSMVGVSRGEWRKGNPHQGVGKGLLSVSADPRGGSMGVSLHLLDPNGVELTSAFMSVALPRPEPVRFDPVEGEKPLAPDPLLIELEGANRWLPDTGYREIATTVDGRMKKLKIPPSLPVRSSALRRDLLQDILHPERREPLALATGPLLTAAAELRGANLVALVQDDVFVPSMNGAVKGMLPSAFLSSPDLQKDHEVTLADGWLTVQPRSLAMSRQRRISRSGLAQLLQSVERRRLLLLDDVGRFALSQENRMDEGQLDLAYLRTVNPSAANHTYHAADWYLYRLFASLTPGQRQSLAAGAALPIGNLTATGQDSVRQLVLRNSSPKLTRADGSELDTWAEGIVDDWTQLLPDGVTGGATLRAAVTKEEAAYAVNAATGAAEIVGPLELASQRFINGSAGLRHSAPTYDRFAPATEWTYEFTFSLAPGVQAVHTLADGTFDDSASLRALDSLPASFRDKMTAEIADLNTFFGSWDFGKFQRNGAPPP